MPLKDSPVSFRAVAEAGFWYWWFYIGGWPCYVPGHAGKNFRLAFSADCAGSMPGCPFLGITLWVAVEVPVNPQLTPMFEGMYAPAYEFGYGSDGIMAAMAFTAFMSSTMIIH